MIWICCNIYVIYIYINNINNNTTYIPSFTWPGHLYKYNKYLVHSSPWKTEFVKISLHTADQVQCHDNIHAQSWRNAWCSDKFICHLSSRWEMTLNTSYWLCSLKFSIRFTSSIYWGKQNTSCFLVLFFSFPINLSSICNWNYMKHYTLLHVGTIETKQKISKISATSKSQNLKQIYLPSYK